VSSGDEDLQALYQRYGPVLLARCRAILGNDEDAMDAVQETFARVIRHREEFRRESSPLTWMYRISTNYCLNQIRNRRGRREKRELNRELLAGEGIARPGTERWESAAVIRALLEDADDQTRAIVIHLYFDDMTRAEAADMVGISQPTLRKRLDLFMQRARRAVGEA
jgi:RNA polymerase sigma-70 factor (ECF subfamily)